MYYCMQVSIRETGRSTRLSDSVHSTEYSVPGRVERTTLPLSPTRIDEPGMQTSCDKCGSKASIVGSCSSCHICGHWRTDLEQQSDQAVTLMYFEKADCSLICRQSSSHVGRAHDMLASFVSLCVHRGCTERAAAGLHVEMHPEV